MTVCFDSDLVTRYGGRGPRYTSYPTALQFHEDFSTEDYEANLLASNGSGDPMSVYVHIPFCQSLCYYCGCNKIVTRNESRVTRYLELLNREIELQSALIDSGRTVKQLHFGGGTPTYLDDLQLSSLMKKLETSFSYAPLGEREFSIEVDPRTVEAGGMARLYEFGFNRLSLGIQDFDPRVQNAVNRLQSAEDVSELLAESRDAGFDSISFDLIYGLPGQSANSFANTLQTVIRMRPDRLAVYNYAHLPQRFKGQRMINEDEIPTPDVKLEILRLCIETLCGAGYEYIGMDHFALPDDDLAVARRNGTLQRNFQGYSTHNDCDLVALGVSSIGSIRNVFSQNAVTTAEYEAILSRDQLPIRKGLVVDADDQLRAEIIQCLTCYDELDLDDIAKRYRINVQSYFKTELRRLGELAEDGLVTIDGAKIATTDKGRLLLRSIAMVFDRYIDQAQNDQRFSKAI